VLGSFYIAGVYRIPVFPSGEFVAENAISMATGGAVHDPVSARGQGINSSTSLPLRRKSGKDKAVKSQWLDWATFMCVKVLRHNGVGRFVIDTRLVDKS